MVLEGVISEINALLVAKTAAVIPGLIAAVLLLVVGWLAGKIFGKIVKKILEKLKVDSYFDFGIRMRVSELFSFIVSWLIYLAFIQSAIAALKIAALTLFVGEILVFVGGLLEAIVIILVGYGIGRFVQKRIIVSKEPYAGLISKVIFFFVIYLAIALALPFVNIDPSLINNILLVIVGSMGAGFAIALGLGLVDTIKSVAKKYARKL